MNEETPQRRTRYLFAALGPLPLLLIVEYYLRAIQGESTTGWMVPSKIILCVSVLLWTNLLQFLVLWRRSNHKPLLSVLSLNLTIWAAFLVFLSADLFVRRSGLTAEYQDSAFGAFRFVVSLLAVFGIPGTLINTAGWFFVQRILKTQP